MLLGIVAICILASAYLERWVFDKESDGTVAPERRVAQYRERGYDFLCLSDHHRITRVDRVPVPNGMTLIRARSCIPTTRSAATRTSRRGTDYPAGPLDPGRPFEHATLLLPQADWLRVEVIDAHGLKAWSNPIDLTRFGVAA